MPVMNNNQLQAAAYEPRCHFCKWKKDHPEIAGQVEYWLLNEWATVKSMIEFIAEDYGVKLSPKQVNHHMTHHLPDQTVIVLRVLEHGLDMDTIYLLTWQNLVLIQALKKLDARVLPNGIIEVDENALLRAIETETKKLEGDKIAIDPPSESPPMPPLTDEEVLKGITNLYHRFVPLNRRQEFRDGLEPMLGPLTMEKARKLIEAHLARQANAGEVTDYDWSAVGILFGCRGTSW